MALARCVAVEEAGVARALSGKVAAPLLRPPPTPPAAAAAGGVKEGGKEPGAPPPLHTPLPTATAAKGMGGALASSLRWHRATASLSVVRGSRGHRALSTCRGRGVSEEGAWEEV